MDLISIMIILLLGLWLPLICLRLLYKHEYTIKQLIIDSFVTLLVFIVFLLGANYLNLSIFDFDSLNSFGILCSLMTTIARKGNIYKVLTYNSLILILLKVTNSLFYATTALAIKDATIITPLAVAVMEGLSAIFALSLTLLLKRIVRKFNLEPKLTYKNNLSIKIALGALGGYVALYGIQFFIRGEFTQDDFIPLFVSIVLVLLIVWLTTYTKNKRNVDLLAEKELYQTQLLTYMSMLESSQQEVRKFKHDYKNMLLSMNGYLIEDDLSGLKTYFSQHILPAGAEQTTANALSALGNLHVIELKGLLMTKLTAAQAAGLNVSLEITEPIDELNLSVIDSCRILGILLDNAIEASCLTTEKDLKIAFISYPDLLEIVVQNSVLEPTPAIHDCFRTGFSTKGKNRGLGLSNVQELIKQSPQANLSTTITQGNFSQCLHISTGGV